MNINPLLARFAGAPALIEERCVARFEADLAAILAHPRADELMAAVNASAADDGFWFAPDDWRSALRPYVVRDGILQIPVKGVLLYDFPWALGSWATGYSYITRALERGLADGNVRGIALIGYSYGGQGDGCFDCANGIFKARAIKPIKSYAQTAYSAGYAIISSGGRVTAGTNSQLGSIGVVMTHLDMSRALENDGLKFTFVKFGKKKTDGNSTEPLPDDVKARWKSWCNEMGMQFCELVARNRGIDVAAVRDTEADCFSASEALALGLVDEITPLDEAITAFSPELSDPDDDQGETDMTTSVPAAGAAAAIITAAALEAAKAESFAAGKAEGVKEGITAERTRIGAILGSDDAKGRGKQANHCAFNTSMTAEDAKAMLATAPTETDAPKDPLAAAMSGVKNPKVGADAAADQSEDAQAATLASSIVNGYLGKPAQQPAS